MSQGSIKKHTCNPSEWVKNYSDELFRFALIRVDDRHEAEDLVQETFYSALKSVKRFRGDSTEKTWLYNILSNKIVDHYRKNKNRTYSSSELLNEDEKNEEGFYDRFFKKTGMFAGHWTDDAKPGRWGENFKDHLESKEFLEILKDCIISLPEKWASVFRMKHFMDKESKEICKELEITSSNFWVIIHRTKLQLRSCLENNWINK